MNKEKELSYPIRILQVFSSAGMHRAGAETLIMNYYHKIDRSKVQFDFIVHTNEKCAYDDEIKLLGGRIYRIPRYTIINHIRYFILWLNFLHKHTEYRIIHGHYFTISAIYFCAAKIFNLVCIAHSHINYKGPRTKRIMKRLITFPVRYIADYLFACSKDAGIWLYGKNALRDKKFLLMNNSLDTKRFIFNSKNRGKKRKELKIINKFVIGHIGRFDLQKNHIFIIEIFKKIFTIDKNSILILVGDGKLKMSIEQKVLDMGLYGNVIFTGARSDIPELLQAMDVFLFPSLYEGFGLVLLEAQASGLKCIVSDTVTKESNITNKIEYLSLDKSPEYWARQILKYKDGYERKNNYKKICDAGYDIEKSAKWLETFYLKEFNKLKNK
jgi:glycosyltransferase involved in cell wall biosynthesis